METRKRALLVIGHGSRERVDEFHQVCAMLHGKGFGTAPNSRVSTGANGVNSGRFDFVQPAFLELSEPSIAEGVERCVSGGACEITAIPLFLTRGGHVKGEIPDILRRAALRHPGLRVRFGDPLGLHEAVREILRERVEAAAPKGPGTALLLVGRGSSDPESKRSLREAIAEFRKDRPRVFEAYMDVLRPSLDEGLEEALASGARRVAVVPCLLFRGTLTRRIDEAVAEARRDLPGVEIAVAPPLGPDPRLVKVLLQRAAEASPLSPRVVMVVGTSSHAGKSLLVAGLCRLLARRGYRVAPFKAQNMSLNSGVTADGGELARAQMLQARAARAEPRVEMNPILLKPTGVGRRSQVVLLGRPWATLEAPDYYSYRPVWEAVAAESLRRLGEEADAIVMEGAGSPAEPNLRGLDFTNLSLAARVGADALLVADIERGGAFASLVGTLALLPPKERACIRGFVLNKFRGDPSLLEPAIRDLETRTGVPVLGIVDHLDDLGLDPEDSITLEEKPPARGRELTIAVIRFPRISNFTDFDALRMEEGVEIRYASRPGDLDGCDAILLPGTKSTAADLACLREAGMDGAIVRRAGRVPILGICGGYQMLGREILDPRGVEGDGGRHEGLGLLDIATEFQSEKVTARVVARQANGGPFGPEPFNAYEIHMGMPRPGPSAEPLFRLQQRNGEPCDAAEGAAAPGGMVWGTSLHGLFDSPAVRRSFLNFLRERRGLAPLPVRGPTRDEQRERGLDRLADHLEERLGPGLMRFLGLEG